MTFFCSDEAIKQFAGSFQPLPKAGMPSDIGAAVAYLASDVAAPFVTGTDLYVDGGATIASAMTPEK